MWNKQFVIDRFLHSSASSLDPEFYPVFPALKFLVFHLVRGKLACFVPEKTLSIHISFFKCSCFSSTLLHYISFEIWVVKYRYPEVPKGQYRDHLDGQLTNVFPTFQPAADNLAQRSPCSRRWSLTRGTCEIFLGKRFFWERFGIDNYQRCNNSMICMKCMRKICNWKFSNLKEDK